MKHPADVLASIAFGLEFLGESSRRVGAYRSSARTLKKLGSKVAEMRASGALAKLPGIGASTLKIVDAALAGRPVEKLTALQDKIPEGIWELRALRGLGAKKLAILHQELGIGSISELEYACNENRLLALKGFGEKTQAKYLAAIAEHQENAGQFRQDHAFEATRTLASVMGDVSLRLCGTLRRAQETVREAVVVVPGLGRSEVLERVAASGHAAGLTAPVLGEHAGLEAVAMEAGGVPLYAVPCPSLGQLGVHMLLATGPQEFVQHLQQRAAERGLALGPAGLFHGEQLLETPDEDSVFAALQVWPVPAQRRDDVTAVPRAQERPPRLVTERDLRGALHNHTTASDGIHSLEAMRAAAQAKGWRYLGISEHSQTAGYAGGLSPSELRAQGEQVARLPASGDATAVLMGVESDILRDGSLDYDVDTLATLDFVVASVHNRFRLPEQEATARMVTAAMNPWTDVIGHPTGRLLLGRPPAPFDVAALLDACARSGCAVELNSNPQRLDLNATHLAMAKERGVLVSISPDAHSTTALDHVTYGVALARRAGLRSSDVLNCLELGELQGWLRSRKMRASATPTIG